MIRIEGAKEHPTKLVQSAAMNSVLPPVPTAKPKLPARLIMEGLLSEAQLKSVIYAEEAHSKILPGTYRVDQHFDIVTHSEEEFREMQFRRGWFLGDGTGCGKGRQVAGIIMSNFAQSRKRALWISKNDKLLEDARRDWQALGGDPKQIVSLSKFAQGSAITMGEGILFITYGTLRSGAKQGKRSRVEQIVYWAGRDTLVSRPVHNRPGLKLQRALADARVVHVSTTGATVKSPISPMPNGLGCGDKAQPFRIVPISSPRLNKAALQQWK
ncbi:MAG: strawberry notch family protein [Alphaproteobacteria bacterium]|nr:strawberry notch family protein [Alphaproteobacteria bacterium]